MNINEKIGTSKGIKNYCPEFKNSLCQKLMICLKVRESLYEAAIIESSTSFYDFVFPKMDSLLCGVIDDSSDI